MNEKLTERLRGMFDMGVRSEDTFNHLTPAGFRLLREAHDEIKRLGGETDDRLASILDYLEGQDPQTKSNGVRNADLRALLPRPLQQEEKT